MHVSSKPPRVFDRVDGCRDEDATSVRRQFSFFSSNDVSGLDFIVRCWSVVGPCHGQQVHVMCDKHDRIFNKKLIQLVASKCYRPLSPGGQDAVAGRPPEGSGSAECQGKINPSTEPPKGALWIYFIILYPLGPVLIDLLGARKSTGYYCDTKNTFEDRLSAHGKGSLLFIV